MIITFILRAFLLASQVESLTESVWTPELAGDCYLDYHTSIDAVALACPGVDYIKLWPLPVEQPWEETPDPFPEGLPGGYAEASLPTGSVVVDALGRGGLPND